jgi:phosphoenolpyruvate-protein phosphotransferase (PTS system enzyme I)
MHPAHILAVKQRVLTTDVATIRPIVDRMRRTDDPVKVVALLDRLND